MLNFTADEFRKEIERQIIEEEAAKESAARNYAVEARVRAYVKQQEKEEERKEREEERLRERALENLPVLDISVVTVRKMYQGKYPLIFLALPERVVELLEEAFACKGNSMQLSRDCSCLIAAFSHAWSSERKKELLEEVASTFAKTHRVEIPVLLSIIRGGISAEQMEHMLCAWAIAWEEMREKKLALSVA